MDSAKKEFRPAGKGFVLAATGDGFPPIIPVGIQYAPLQWSSLRRRER